MRLLRWFLFSIVISLVPLAVSAVEMMLHPDPVVKTWIVVLVRGELLLISTAIASDAIGDLVAAGTGRAGWKIFSGGLCLIALLFAALSYPGFQHPQGSDLADLTYVHFVVGLSVVNFVVTVIAAGACKGLAQE